MEKGVSKPPSAFILYSRDARKEIDKNLSYQEISQKIAIQWKNLEPSKKSIYLNQAKDLLEEYRKKQSSQVKKTRNRKKSTKNNPKIKSEEAESLNKLAELFMPKSGKKTRSKDKFTLMQYTLEMNRSAKIKPKPKPEQN